MEPFQPNVPTGHAGLIAVDKMGNKACGSTDMRNGMTGLAMLVQQGLSADPFDGAVFVFRGRRPQCVS